MNIVVGFAPFIVFFVLLKLASVLAGLAAAFAVALFSLTRAWRKGESLKVLDIGAIALFGVLALVAATVAANWSVGGVRLAVDGGLALISLVSLAIGRPFTLQYAREQTPEAYWNAPTFVRANQLITGVWTLAFAIFAACDAAAIYLPAIRLWLEAALTIAALGGATAFTAWYPSRLRRSPPRAK